MLFHDDLADFIATQRSNLKKWDAANIPEVGVIRAVLGPKRRPGHGQQPGRPFGHATVDRLAVDCHGIAGDRHRGLTRPSTGREAPLYKEVGVTIVNRRQIFAVSSYECHLLTRSLGVRITPGLLGANVVIDRDDGADYCISEVPLNTYFAIAPAGAAELPRTPIATLIQYLQQKGCSRTGRAITREYGDAALTKRFVAHAEHRRGILCSVEYPVDAPAYLERGQKVFFRFPMGACY